MEKRIEDYLHLYYGQMATIEWTHGQRENGVYPINWYILQNIDSIKNIQINLRELDSITEEEWIEAEMLEGPLGTWLYNAESIRYLLSKGFDLFDLIPSNPAIDKNK